MSERDASSQVPSWDGQAKGWRRYTKEVAWFVASTPVHKRRYVASKLIGRLQGPARLLAMSWNRGEFDAPDGTLTFLRKLSSSPLVRRTLPNTAAILQQYLSFRRRGSENMATFLVRETLGYEEFSEALIRLWEERNGIDQSEMNFGLPPVQEEEADDSWSWWYGDGYDGYDGYGGYEVDVPASGEEEQPAEAAATTASASAETTAAAAAGRASAGSSPSHGEPPVVVRPPSLRAVSIQAPSVPGGVNEISVADSFIMGVLRGWRLLQAACLSPDETRDILSATQNSLDFEAVSRALQTMWDEQLLGYRPPSSNAVPSNYGHLNWHGWEEEDWPADDWDTGDDDWWENQWHEEWHGDEWPDDDHAIHHAATEEVDEQILEAQKAEQAAEQLAVEAQRTWAEAQRTTQQLRKDRGFGQVNASAAASGKCFSCGGNHFVRDCPDARLPPYGKSHGKGFQRKGNYMVDYSDYHANYVKGKGRKGMGKGKSKFSNAVDQELMWSNSRFRGKGKGKVHHGKPASSVNAYSVQYDIGGLEMQTSEIQQALTKQTSARAAKVEGSGTTSSCGMLDCGATASAAPDVAVNGLIQTILKHDTGARVNIEPYMRPHFRFGNGRWGQALYRVTISSTVSGELRKFSLFALPNPEEMQQKNLVPVLVGMDHIGYLGCQMLVDFSTGYVIDGVDPDPKIYQMNTNAKGHFEYDIVYHLTRGKTNLDGSAVVHVDRQACTLSTATLQFRPLEFYMSHVQKSHEVDFERSKQLLMRLYHHVRSSSNSAHMQISSENSLPPDDIPFRDLLARDGISRADESPDDSRRTRCGGLHREDAAQDIQKCSASRQSSNHPDGPSRSKSSEQLALLRSACGRNLAEQSSRSLDALRGVQHPHGLHPQEGIPEFVDTSDEPCHGQNHAGRAGAPDAWSASHGSHLQGNDGQDHCGAAAGDSGGCSNPGLQEGQEHSCDFIQDNFKDQGRRVRFSENCTQSGKLGVSGSRSVGTGDLVDRGGKVQVDGDLEGTQGRDEQSESGITDHGVNASSLKVSSSLQSSTFLKSSMSLKSPADPEISSSLQTSTTRKNSMKPLPRYVAGKVMQMVALMTSNLMSVALDISLEGRVGLWEIACSDGSWLTASAQHHGISARRINYSQGYDIYKDETWERLKAERRREKPKKLWFSLPCTRWCQWTQVNYNTPEKKAVLETMRRRERRMLRRAADFILSAVDEDPYVDVYFEWTHPCSGWKQRPMMELEANLEQRGIAWESCRIDGCNYGMKEAHGDLFLHKKWMIKTTDELFHKNFRAKVCPKNHQHALIQGLETARSAYYPKRMVESIVRHWCRELAPLRHVKTLATDCVQPCVEDENWQRRLNPISSNFETQVQSNLFAADEVVDVADEEAAVPGDPLADVPKKEQELWEAKLRHYHRAAGHPSNRNLIHLFRDAGLPEWKIYMARNLKCEACESIKLGGSSSGSIPPAATHVNYKPWQAVGLDASEWLVPGQKVKLRFLLFIDMATKLKVIHIVREYSFLEKQTENTEETIKGFTERWLVDKPKPEILIPDNAKHYKGHRMHEFCNSVGIQLSLPAERESWAHGVVEAAIKDVKMTASAIQIDQPKLDPCITLNLACAALNSTEHVKGYTPFQWCYGKDYSLTDEDVRSFRDARDSDESMSFEALVRARQDAEAVAKKTRSLRIMSRLQNSKVRQPLRTFEPTQLVKVWRKQWPSELHQGKRGGSRLSVKPHWVGPGRVVFHEVLNHQAPGDERRHLMWVVIGSQLMRCSVHSVRPVTSSEQIAYEVANKDDPSQWRSIADLLPQRNYVDLSDEVPGENEVEEPFLPEKPDPSTTLVPLRRAIGKQPVPPTDMVTAEERRLLNETTDETQEVAAEVPAEINDYGNDDYSPEVLPQPPEKKQKTDASSSSLDDSTASRKIPREDNMLWLKNLVQQEDESWNHFQASMEDDGNVFTIEVEVEVDSNRTRKNLLRNPVAFLVKKMRDSEVVFGKLSNADKQLFCRAKAKEVSSFLQNEAVRKCLDDKEIKDALGSGRILRARWVLTWKLVPPEDQREAQQDALNNPNTVHTKAGDKKAKARIVLLGYEHPELGSSSYRTSSPVQSLLARNLLYQMVCQHDWKLEGLDLATAFLQTQPTSADAEMWTTGVAELREALGVGAEGVMKIMKNIYGSTTAPRGLWLDLHRKLCDLGAKPAMGERCLWMWTSSTEVNDDGTPVVIGMMGGHVDDFHRIGCAASHEWQAICAKVDQAYRWGTVKSDEYRHAGTDIKLTRDQDGDQVITVNQQYYIDMLTDVDIPPDRLNDESAKLSSAEQAICRGSLGSLQWLAIQTQPQICGRCNILLSELVKHGKMSSALEIQKLICEVRQQPAELKFFKIKKAKNWKDVSIITFADQAHSNRPGGDSTGGMVTMMAGPEAKSGQVCPMILLSWRAWKLQRKAIGSNDAEVQAALESEDHNFRVRLLWSELHGAGWHRPVHVNQVAWAEKQVREIAGFVCTDSRGGYNAVMVNESPLLGLSNLRSALQAMQLRESLIRAASELRWLASDFDLGDSMTKKRPDCRVGLLKYLKSRLWCIAFDPSFTAAKKNAQRGKSAVKLISTKESRSDFSLWADATCLSHLSDLDSWMFDASWL